MYIALENPTGFAILEYGTTVTLWAQAAVDPVPIVGPLNAEQFVKLFLDEETTTCKKEEKKKKPEPVVITYQWTVDGVVVDQFNDEADWSCPSFDVNTWIIKFRFTPRLIPALRRKNYVIGCAASNGATAGITLRVAQERAISTQALLTNAALTARVVPALVAAAEFDDDIADYVDTLRNENQLNDSPLTYRVQNGRITIPGANMAAVSVGIQRRGAVIVVDPSAYGTYETDDFNSMLRHEAVHCGHYLESHQEAGLWRMIREVLEVWDIRAESYTDLMTPCTESEAWMSYLTDPSVSYYFLRHYRVFARLDEYLWQAQRLIVGLRERGTRNPPRPEDERRTLASACEGLLRGIANRAAMVFPELKNLLPDDRDFVRFIHYDEWPRSQ
jgi:hypothetical protein